MTEAELERLRTQAKEDRKLLQKAEQVLAEIDRGPGLNDVQADVLAAIRIRLTGKERAKLEDLLTAAGDLGGGKKDLGDVLSGPEKTGTTEWPAVEEKKRDWPDL
ncbi:MAG: hypothetical protein KY391_05515 [Actinobacteria bacterium]|nr:hypothetical protein [Actinomycetota bacterium]